MHVNSKLQQRRLLESRIGPRLDLGTAFMFGYGPGSPPGGLVLVPLSQVLPGRAPPATRNQSTLILLVSSNSMCRSGRGRHLHGHSLAKLMIQPPLDIPHLKDYALAEHLVVLVKVLEEGFVEVICAHVLFVGVVLEGATQGDRGVEAAF